LAQQAPSVTAIKQHQHRFRCELAAWEIQDRLHATSRPWRLRRFRGEYVVTALDAPDPRMRIEPSRLGPGDFLLLQWGDGAPSAAAEVLGALNATGATALPAEWSRGRAAGECAVLTFAASMPLAHMRERVAKIAPAGSWANEDDFTFGPCLRMAVRGTDRIEEQRWLIRRAGERFVLELVYDGNPFEERRWRELADQARRAAAAVASGPVEEPAEWEILVNRIEHHRAWAFTSPLPLPAMQEVLARTGTRTWDRRDNDRHGDYLASGMVAPYASESRLRVVEDGGRFTFDVAFASEHPLAEEEWNELQSWIRTKALPALQAQGVREDDPLD
jgi:hypothetical protein